MSSASTSLSQRLRDSSASAHAQSDTYVRRNAPLAFTDKRLYGALLSQFYWVYRTIEDSLDGFQSHAQMISILPMLKQARRADAFLVDIAYYTGAAPDSPLPATEAYIKAITAAAKRGPLLLLVYAYTMYLALLAGGAILSRMLRAAMRLPPGKGSAIFDFDAAIPPAERKRFRENLKGALDSIGDNIKEEEVMELVNEKISIFSRNNQVIKEVLVARAPQAGLAWPLQLARAYLLLFYGALLALLRLAFVDWPLRALAVPRHFLDSLTGRNSGWVGH